MDRRAVELKRRSFLALGATAVGALLRRARREDAPRGQVVLAGDDGPLDLEPTPVPGTRFRLVLEEGAGSERIVTEDAGTIALRLDPRDSLALVNDRGLAESVEAAGRITFEGGAPPSWSSCLHPRGPSLLLTSIERAFAGGATLAARGRAAASVSALSIVGDDEWDDEDRNPRRTGQPTLWAGFGFFPFAAVELGRGASLGRLLTAMASERVRSGVYLEPASALHLEPDSDVIRARGAGAVFWCDFRGARRLGRSVRGARLSRLFDGDRVDGESGAIHLGADTDPEVFSGTGVRRTEERQVADALDEDAIRGALAGFTEEGPARIELRDASRVLTLSLGEASVAASDPGGMRSLAGILLDLEWTA